MADRVEGDGLGGANVVTAAAAAAVGRDVLALTKVVMRWD